MKNKQIIYVSTIENIPQIGTMAIGASPRIRIVYEPLLKLIAKNYPSKRQRFRLVGCGYKKDRSNTEVLKVLKEIDFNLDKISHFFQHPDHCLIQVQEHTDRQQFRVIASISKTTMYL